MFICEQLSDLHDLSRFHCGEPGLDDWLKKSARDSDGRRITRTYVWHEEDGVAMAYFALMPFVIEREALTKVQSHGLPSTIPCYLIAKLALDETLHGRRLGSQLLASALQRLVAAAEEVGGHYAVVDSISPSAVRFYLHHGFQPIPGNSDRLVLAVRDVTARL